MAKSDVLDVFAISVLADFIVTLGARGDQEKAASTLGAGTVTQPE